MNEKKHPKELSDIIKRIKNRRTELRLSYQDLADKTGMSKSTLQRYETGFIKNMPLDKLEILASSLDTTPAYLMGWESEIISSNDLNPQYINFAKELQDAGLTEEDMKKLLQVYEMFKTQNK